MNTKFRVGDKVRVRKDLKDESYYGGVFFDPEMKEFFGKVLTIELDLYDRYGVVENSWYWSDEMLEPVANHSLIGKKAYKTFLKNGGSRNSKGQFSKKFSWQKVYDEVREVSNYIDFLVEKEKIVKWDRITKIYLKVFQKHGLISKEIEI